MSQGCFQWDALSHRQPVLRVVSPGSVIAPPAHHLLGRVSELATSQCDTLQWDAFGTNAAATPIPGTCVCMLAYRLACCM
jgi:hypothetical protein